MSARHTKLQVHPAADAFPMMTADELADLAADIEANGLLEPVVLTPDGLLLDGRNRYAACEQLKIEPKTTVYDGDPIAFVIALNVHRRHLTAGQRAMIVARLFAANNLTQEDGAAQVGVSRSRVAYADVVLRYAPDLADAVVAGSHALDAAYEIATSRKKAATTDEELLAKLPPDLATAVTEGDLSLEEAGKRVIELKRIAELPTDLAERVQVAQLAVDEAETILRERRERLAAWADNLREAMRRLARMATDPVPEELAAQFTDDERAVLVTILDALNGGDYGFLG